MKVGKPKGKRMKPVYSEGGQETGSRTRYSEADADVLTNAIDAVDLPALVADAYPNSGAQPGRQAVVRAEWRGDQHPSFSLYRSRDGIWMFKDHATGDTGSAWHFLTVIAGMGNQEAAELILNRVGANPGLGQPVRVRRVKAEWDEPLNCEAKPIPKAVLDELLWGYQDELTPQARRRGFIETDVQLLGLQRDGPDIIIPIYDPRGVIVGVKRKVASPGKSRYFYEVDGHGAPAWCNPGFQESGRVLVIEGELNAMIAASVMRERLPNARMSIMGVAGANSSMHSWTLKDREVYIYADGDAPGQQARARWAAQAKEAGADTVHLLAPDERDFCEIAEQDGRESLYNHLAKLINTAQTAYGQDDRRIGYYTIRELNEATDRYMRGTILIPTGYRELDVYTQGLPDSGIIGIGALPSMGKSIFLRDVMLNYVESDKNHRVMLFSPDQSVPSIMRLLASRRSGIPAWRVRAKSMTSDILERHGSVKDAVKHWRDVYDDTVLHMTKRFLISEEADLSEVKEAMLRAIDGGVSMFGGDYLQMFEAETSRGDEIDGKAIKDFKKFCREHKVPMLFAVQLAKYKFDRTRRSGIPYSPDIEGSGKIFQQSELFFMIYNYHLYSQEYAEREVEGSSEYARHPQSGYIPLARIYVRKNKEGMRNDFRYLKWDAEIPSFRNMNEDVVTPGSRFTDEDNPFGASPN